MPVRIHTLKEVTAASSEVTQTDTATVTLQATDYRTQTKASASKDPNLN